MKLIVGLGNPGQKYHKTRHNIGFMAIDMIANQYQLSLKFDSKFNAEIVCSTINQEKICFVKPSTYMNLSGEAVSKIMKYYDIEIEDILIIVDDVNLPTGKIRIRELGGHGGHNGLRNLIGLLHSENFKRVRIGIDNQPERPLDQYVLGQFSTNELIQLSPALNQTTEIVDSWIKNIPFKDIMTKYNTQT